MVLTQRRAYYDDISSIMLGLSSLMLFICNWNLQYSGMIVTQFLLTTVTLLVYFTDLKHNKNLLSSVALVLALFPWVFYFFVNVFLAFL